MYSKHEASLLNQQFWTTFGKYMAPVLSAGGEKINWINYKTGIKFIRLHMEATDNSVTIAIELSNPDVELRQQQFNRLYTFKKQFEALCSNEWQWQKTVMVDYGKIISRIICTLENVSILNKAHWPAVISFLKPQLISFDEFWNNYKFALE